MDLAPRSVSDSFLTTTYYDTADRALGQCGVSLRVREANGRFLQAVKSTKAWADVLARSEWKDEIASTFPDIRAPVSGGHLPEGIADLKPLFATVVKRTTMTFEPSPSLKIEAAIDTGEILGFGSVGGTPINEIKLELKRGEPRLLFSTALELLSAAPLHIEARSKFERGCAAAEGEIARPRAIRPTPIVLDPAMSVEAALQRIGRACLAHLLRNEPAALAEDPEGVHQMRVASRRIRSIILDLKKAIPAAERHWLSRELDLIDNVLGPVRNLDVFANELLPAVRASLASDPALDQLASAVDAPRQKAYARVSELMQSRRYTEAMLRLLRWFETLGWRNGSSPSKSDLLLAPISEVATRLLDRRLRSVRKRGKGFERATARQRHKLRIACKEFRYTVELLGSLFNSQEVRRFVKRLKALQDNLGYANDVRVARDVVKELAAQSIDKAGIELTGARVLRWHKHAMQRVERQIRKHLRRVKQDRPFW
jgi:inorganic triphosphatase YgiF